MTAARCGSHDRQPCPSRGCGPTFDKRRRYHMNHDLQNRAWMITLKERHGRRTRARGPRPYADYDDPLRWWL